MHQQDLEPLPVLSLATFTVVPALDPRDPLLQSERMQGCAADPVCVNGEVFAYVGLP